MECHTATIIVRLHYPDSCCSCCFKYCDISPSGCDSFLQHSLPLERKKTWENISRLPPETTTTKRTRLLDYESVLNYHAKVTLSPFTLPSSYLRICEVFSVSPFQA